MTEAGVLKFLHRQVSLICHMHCIISGHDGGLPSSEISTVLRVSEFSQLNYCTVRLVSATSGLFKAKTPLNKFNEALQVGNSAGCKLNVA